MRLGLCRLALFSGGESRRLHLRIGLRRAAPLASGRVDTPLRRDHIGRALTVECIPRVTTRTPTHPHPLAHPTRHHTKTANHPTQRTRDPITKLVARLVARLWLNSIRDLYMDRDRGALKTHHTYSSTIRILFPLFLPGYCWPPALLRYMYQGRTNTVRVFRRPCALVRCWRRAAAGGGGRAARARALAPHAVCSAALPLC